MNNLLVYLDGLFSYLPTSNTFPDKEIIKVFGLIDTF